MPTTVAPAPVAIVTGASRGIGRAVACALAASGHAIVAVARDAAKLDETAVLCREAGAPDVFVLACDLADPKEPARIAVRVMEHFGRIDRLVNVAGATPRGDFLTLTDEDHISGFALKYHAAVRLCRACWPHLAEAGGSIVNIAGVGGLTPEAEFTIGGPVNSALMNLSKALSRIAPDQVRVNSLCPGHIVTDRLRTRIDAVAREKGIPFEEAREVLRQRLGVSRFGQPEDVGNAVAWLCSDAAKYVIGTNMVVDGGATPGL